MLKQCSPLMEYLLDTPPTRERGSCISSGIRSSPHHKSPGPGPQIGAGWADRHLRQPRTTSCGTLAAALSTTAWWKALEACQGRARAIIGRPIIKVDIYSYKAEYSSVQQYAKLVHSEYLLTIWIIYIGIAEFQVCMYPENKQNISGKPLQSELSEQDMKQDVPLPNNENSAHSPFLKFLTMSEVSLKSAYWSALSVHQRPSKEPCCRRLLSHFLHSCILRRTQLTQRTKLVRHRYQPFVDCLWPCVHAMQPCWLLGVWLCGKLPKTSKMY